jgi:hypothetical protein
MITFECWSLEIGAFEMCALDSSLLKALSRFSSCSCFELAAPLLNLFSWQNYRYPEYLAVLDAVYTCVVP